MGASPLPFLLVYRKFRFLYSEYRRTIMPICSLCGNDYDKAFAIFMDNEKYMFDSFECAIQLLAPACGHCGCKVIGHGVESRGIIFCCAHCAQMEGVQAVQDRAD